MVGYIVSHGKSMDHMSSTIKRLRKRLGIPQWIMAERMGMDRHTYSLKEDDPAKMTVKEFYQIADLLRVRATNLLREEL